MSISRYWSFFTTLLFIVVHSERDSFGLKRLGENQLTSVYFIGDLHADVVCVQQWMNATRLIDFSESPYKWTGGADEAIVFMGDYVDKGSTSSSVLSFMKELQETFPDNVITLLGNHDFFLILDTVLEFNQNNPHPLGRPKYEYTYGWMHVEEYTESDFTTKREGDEELLGAILQGLQHAYDLNREKELYLCAPQCLDESQIDLFTTVSPFVDNQTLAIRYVFL
jgi:predicted MPP superfamily phosphohydrolase